MNLFISEFEDAETLARFGETVAPGGSAVGLPEYYQWLLSSDGFGVVHGCVKDEDEIVGMLHEIRAFGTDKTKSSTCFNFFSDPSLAASGFPLMAYIMRKKRFFIPGVQGALAESYKKMKAREVASLWMRKIHFRTNWIKLLKDYARSGIHMPDHYSEDDQVVVTNMLSDEVLHDVTARLFGLSVEYVRWRLASKGSRRCVVSIDQHGDGLVIGVIGYRKRVPVLRIIHLSGSSPSVRRSHERMQNFARACGIAVTLITVFSASQAFGAVCSSYALMKSQPLTMIKGDYPVDECFLGLVSDLGLQEQWGSMRW